MTTRDRIISLVLLLGFAFTGCIQVRAKTNEMTVATVLIRQFETVFYTKAALLSQPGGFNGLSKTEANPLRIPFSYLTGALNAIGNGAARDVLASSKAVFIGAKHFQAPSGLGSVRSESCYVIVLQNPAFDLRKLFISSPETVASGSPIWGWSAKLGEFGENDPRASSLYATQVAGSYVLVCNTMSEIGSLAAQLAGPERKSEAVPEPQGWQILNQHQLWGYRQYHYGPENGGDTKGTRNITPTAHALMFFVDFREKEGVLRLFASDSSTPEALNSAMVKAGAALPRLVSSGSGAWEAVIPLDSDQKSPEMMFDVMGLFGFATYL